MTQRLSAAIQWLLIIVAAAVALYVINHFPPPGVAQ